MVSISSMPESAETTSNSSGAPIIGSAIARIRSLVAEFMFGLMIRNFINTSGVLDDLQCDRSKGCGDERQDSSMIDRVLL